MNAFRLLLAEIRYRKLNFVLSLVAIAVAAALFVAGPILVDGYSRETRAELGALEAGVRESARRVTDAEAAAAADMAQLEDDTRKAMLALGFNLLLVHRDEDIVGFLASGQPTIDMPQSYVQKLAADPRLTFVTHLVGTLRGKVDFDGRSVRLVGYLPEVPQKHMQHTKPMGYAIEPGTALLGFRLGADHKVGDTIELAGRPLKIAQVLPEQGTDEDGTIVVNLADAQAILHQPEKINVILALECRCNAAALPRLRRQLGEVLPETQVLRDTSRADARAAQRALVAEKHQQIVAQQKRLLADRQQALADTTARRERMQGLMETLAGVVTPLVVLAAAIWVGLLALSNVRERRVEIGVLRALGKSSGMIAALFLGKAIVLGFLGAAVGASLGAAAAEWIGRHMLQLAAAQSGLPLGVVTAALLGAPLLAALASYLPTLSAVLQDPAAVLRDA